MLLDSFLFLCSSGLRRWWIIAVNILELVMRWLDPELTFRFELERFMKFLSILVPTHGILFDLINCVEPKTVFGLAIPDSFWAVWFWLCEVWYWQFKCRRLQDTSALGRLHRLG